MGAGLDEVGRARFEVARLVRHLAIVGAAGAVAGLIAGAGGRLLMRIAAIMAPDGTAGALTDNGNRVGEITLGGSLVLILGRVLVGGAGAVFFLISEPWLRRLGAYRGGAFGVFLLLVAGGSSNTLEPANRDFMLVGSEALIVPMFVALFLLFGLLIAPLATRLDGWLPDVGADRPLWSARYYTAMSLVGLLLAIPLIVAYTAEDERGADPEYLVGGLLLLTAVATVLTWAAPIRGRSTPWRGTPVLGYAALVGAAIAGGLVTVSDIAEII